MSRRKKPPARDWRDDIVPGDVLYEGGDPNRARVVRTAKKDPRFGGADILGWVQFAIRHCSWTGRPFTTVCRSDLKARGFQPSGVRVTKMTLLDKRLQADLERPVQEKSRLSCCDVRGML